MIDTFQQKVDDSAFVSGKTDWKEFYGDTEEDIPPCMLEPLGKSEHMTYFVDNNHAGNVVTRRSQTVVFIYAINAMIIWFSNNQSTVYSSTFGS